MATNLQIRKEFNYFPRLFFCQLFNFVELLTFQTLCLIALKNISM